jgi:surface polysaccharide O-acyltransferase-like enzyme
LGGFIYPWGMPLFFAAAGAASGFALRRETARRYLVDRVTRLLIPYLAGVLLLSPIQAYLDLTHKGRWTGGGLIAFLVSPALRDYIRARLAIGLGPRLLNRLGYHLWLVGFTFLFSVLALPLFTWLKRDAGKRLVGGLAGWAARRGGLLILAVPPILARWLLQRSALGDDYDWVDLAYYLLFFLLGYVLYADERFAAAVERDGRLHLALAVPCTLWVFSSAAGVPVWEWLGSRGSPGFYLSWTLWGLNSWCWTLVILRLAKRRLNQANRLLGVAQQAIWPFFYLHQPAILLVAFAVVRQPLPLVLQIPAVVAGAFALSLGASALIARCLNPVRLLSRQGPRRKAKCTPCRTRNTKHERLPGDTR